MDPLTAFSLAANIVTIVDVTAKVVQTTREISTAGGKTEFVDIESQTKIVQSLLDRLKPALDAGDVPSEDDQSLIQLCEQSKNVSEQVLHILDKCKFPQGTGKLSIDSFWRAIRSEWNQNAIKDLQDRLESIAAKVHRLVTVRYAVNILEALKAVEQLCTTIGSSHVAELQNLHRSIQQLLEAQKSQKEGGYSHPANGSYPEERDSISRAGQSDCAEAVVTSRLLMRRAAETGGLGKDYAIQAGILDIAAYVRDTLGSHPFFKGSDEKDTLGADLIQSVVNRSNGVFLWVRLVVDELSEGLTNQNTIAKLQQKLDQLPQELELFYDHMLNRVAKPDHGDSAQMLIVAVEAQDLLAPMAYWFISEGQQQLAVDQEVKPTGFRHNIQRRRAIEARLQNFCRGLLVVQDVPLGPKFVAVSSSSLFGQCVIFLHRTIREWLSLREVQRRLDGWRRDDFDIDEIICSAVLAQVRTSPTEKEYFDQDGPIENLLKTFVAHHTRLYPRRTAQAEKFWEGMTAVLAKQSINGHSLRLDSPVAQATTNENSPDPVAESVVLHVNAVGGSPATDVNGSADHNWKPSCHDQPGIASADSLTQKRNLIPVIGKERFKRFTRWKVR
ncbi:hypothetical protein M409DRAFT_59412 [Zasmidium cellare ATCC 36951]|uniref:Fungal N-terminal domain-containing protein n=1 Tax=Zasmidium cellare ATCC 36951 TaxID=1080233 RepID=A0A6A6C2J2_ZASCE|nr:uncharacterized protein M409DRAFT_59412 [Zasmidium cellare ATCC 36951]KAF2161153.1 hypothetical protein M409DRAFT_59412 [Zasmidium cellare ATCC 36951]